MIKFPLSIITQISLYFVDKIIKNLPFTEENEKFKHLRLSILNQTEDTLQGKQYNRKVSIKLLNYIRSIRKKIQSLKLSSSDDPKYLLNVIFNIIYKLRAANYMKFKYIEVLRLKLKVERFIVNIKETNIDKIFNLVISEFR